MFISSADLGCEKFDGAAYDECVLSEKNNTATIKEEDVDKSEEANCKQYRDANAMKSCLERAHQAATTRANNREEAERLQEPKPQTKCNVASAYNACSAAYKNSQKLMSIMNIPISDKDSAIQSCLSACTRVTPSVSAKFAGCTMIEIKEVNVLFAHNHPKCGISGSSSAIADPCTTPSSKACKDKLAAMATDMANGTYIGDAETTLSDGTRINKQEITEGVSLVVNSQDTRRQGVPLSYFTAEDGTRFSTLEEATSYQNRGRFASADSTRQRVEMVDGTGDSEVMATSPTPRSRPESAPAGGVPADGATTRATATTEPPTTTQTGDTNESTASNVQPNTNPVSTNPFPTNLVGGSPSGSASSSFANPFGNSSLSLASNSSADMNSNGASASNIGDNDYSEGVGGGSLSGSSFGSPTGGLKGPAGSPEQKTGGSSVGISNGGTSGTSLGGSSPAPVAVAVKASVDRSPSANSIETAAFQSGYHKTPAASAPHNSGNKKIAAAAEKSKKLRRKKVTSTCTGDMQCITTILGQPRRSRKGSRGLASVQPALPNGIWESRTDILSHMANIHNKMNIDSFTGELVPSE